LAHGPSEARSIPWAGGRDREPGHCLATTRCRVPLGRIDCARPLTEGAAQAMAMPRRPPVGPFRRSRDCTCKQSDRLAARQQTCQVRDCLTARGGAAVRGHQVPGRPLPLRVHPHQKVVGFRALERDRPEAAVAIPGEDSGQRSPAEPAILMEQDHGAFPCPHGFRRRCRSSGPLESRSRRGSLEIWFIQRNVLASAV
jgi:hypothetical protein